MDASMVGTVATVGRIAGHVVAEKVRAPRARTSTDVPRVPDDAGADWYTAALAPKVGGARVVDVDRLGGSSGTSTRRRVRLTWNEAGRSAGLPEHLYVKTTTSLTQRLMLGLTDIIRVEGLVYDHVLPLVKLEVPAGYHFGFEPRSWRSIVVTEDVGVTRDATFYTPQQELTLEQAAELVTQMATWHGTLWDHPVLREGWLQTTAERHASLSRFLDWSKASRVGYERAGDVVPREIASRHEQVVAAYGAAMQLGSRGPLTFLHGDPHCAGNYYETGGGRMGWADWGVCLRGGWGYDYAYFVTSSLTIEQRRSWERQLLEHYLAELGAAGAPAPSFDDAWLTYRQQALYPAVAWAAVFGHGPLQPDSQPPEYCLPIIERATNAVLDLDSIHAV